MKIKQNLVIFLIILIFNYVQYSYSKTNEKTILVNKFIKGKNIISIGDSKAINSKLKSYDLKLVVIQDINKPLNSIVREYNVETTMESQFLTLKNKQGKNKKQRIYWSE